MIWFWFVILVWGAAGVSGFIALLIEASNDGEAEVEGLGLFAFLFFAVIGPFVWLLVWRYDSNKKKTRHK
jgi:hypothetical protein